MGLAQRALKTWIWYQFTQSNLATVPTVSGIYCLGVNNGIIYIGSSHDLHERLTEHYYSTDTCIQKAGQFAIEPCSNYLERERERLQAFRAEHGRLPECNDRL